MAYSIVDRFIYARPDEFCFTNAPDFALFERLSDQCSDEQFAELYKVYMRAGDQTAALIEWAKQKGLRYEQ